MTNFVAVGVRTTANFHACTLLATIGVIDAHLSQTSAQLAGALPILARVTVVGAPVWESTFLQSAVFSHNGASEILAR